MLAVFAHTGGLTGAEVVVAGGTSALGQKVLEAIFGDQAVRTLAAQARDDLLERVDRLLREDAERFAARPRRGRARGGELRPAARGGGRDPPRRVKGDLDERLAALGEAVATSRRDGSTDGRRSAPAPSSRRRARGWGSGSSRPSSRSPGPTGAGKSQLFNALAGEELAAVGRRRPTTSAGQAAVWGDGADALLDWLEIPSAATGSPPTASTALCCSTCPTSTRSRPRTGSRWTGSSSSPTSSSGSSSRRSTPTPRCTTATCARSPRTGRRWRSSSTRPISLSGGDVDAWRADMERLLAADGVRDAPLLVVSRARRGDGILDELRRLLAERVRARDAAVARLAADVDDAAEALAAALRWQRRRASDARDRRRLSAAALEDAAGVPPVVRAVEAAHRRRAALCDGLAVRPLARRFRPDPLRRLRPARSAP